MRASTFHSAALALLRRFAGDPGRILSTKALLLRQIGNRLPPPYKFRPAGDLATEVEWAKNRRLTPDTYLDGLDGHEPPIPADLAHRVFREYERRKDEAGTLDFEDLLERTIRTLEGDEAALALVRERWSAFTVDEYQDVNLLQQTLLELLLGERDELCAVGDDYQSIYGFTGASAEWLLALPRRFRECDSGPARAELPLDAAGARGCEPARAATRRRREDPARHPRRRAGAGGPPGRRCRASDRRARRSRRGLRGAGAARADERARRRFRRVAARRGHPVPGRLAARARRGATAVEGASARRSSSGACRSRCRSGAGLARAPPEKLGEREQTRQADLARLVRLAEQFDGEVGAFVASLHERFGATAGRGVHLLTLHRAKGLEFEAVHISEGRGGRAAEPPADVDDERRLLYVGLTARNGICSSRGTGKPSRFLKELGVAAGNPAARTFVGDDAPPGFDVLREWRLERAKADEVPAYVVFHNATLAEIAERRPSTLAELGSVPGVGPAKLERYGEDVLAALAASPRKGGEQQVEHQRRVASNPLARGVALVQVERARVGQRLQAPVADQLLVDAAEPAPVRRVDGDAERRCLAVHRAARRDDEVGERDQALRVDRGLREDHGREVEGAHVLALLLRPREHERVDVLEPTEMVERHREERVRVAVVERDVRRRAEHDEHAARVDAEAVEQRAVGHEVREVVLLLQPRVLDELRRPRAVRREPLRRDRVRYDDLGRRAAAELVLQRRELVVERRRARDAEAPRGQRQLVRAVGERDVEVRGPSPSA